MNAEQIIDLLGPDGEARSHFRKSNGDWVDGFFDKVVEELAVTHLEDLTLKFGAVCANIATTQGGRIQLNVRWDPNKGWAVYHGDDFQDALSNMWQQINMINNLKGEEHV